MSKSKPNKNSSDENPPNEDWEEFLLNKQNIVLNTWMYYSYQLECLEKGEPIDKEGFKDSLKISNHDFCSIELYAEDEAEGYSDNLKNLKKIIEDTFGDTFGDDFLFSSKDFKYSPSPEEKSKFSFVLGIFTGLNLCIDSIDHNIFNGSMEVVSDKAAIEKFKNISLSERLKAAKELGVSVPDMKDIDEMETVIVVNLKDIKGKLNYITKGIMDGLDKTLGGILEKKEKGGKEEKKKERKEEREEEKKTKDKKGKDNESNIKLH